MIALIWKEIRENLKWALLGALVLGVAEFYTLYQTRYGMPDYYNAYPEGITVCKRAFLTVTTFGCAALGFLLGLIQVLPELNRDRWAALLHRPTPRGRIYLGKALAGVLLYAAAAGLPFCFCVWWVATPGHFAAPFVPGLALPGLADTCLGLVYYFAGLLLALHHGGWVAARVLPLLAAGHATSFAQDTEKFGSALGGIALMAAALVLAGWGAIHHLESWNGRPWLGKIAFLAVAFYGLCGLGDLSQFVVWTGYNRNSSHADYELSDDGRPLKITYTKGVVTSVEDPDGHPVTEPEYQPDQIRSHVHYVNICTNYIGDSHGWESGRTIEHYRMSFTYLAAGNPYSFPRLEQWFYVMSRRYVIGMLPKQRVSMALLDANGFEPASAVPLPFPSRVNLDNLTDESYCLWDADSVRLASLSRQTIVNLPLPVPGPIYGVSSVSVFHNNGYVNFAAVVLGTAMVIYDQEGHLVATLPYHRDVDRWGSLGVAINGRDDRFYLWYNPSLWQGRKARQAMPSYFDEMDAQGQVLHSYTLSSLPEAPTWIPWTAYFVRRLQSPVFFFGTQVYEKVGAALGSTELQDRIHWQFGEDWPWTKATAIWIVVLSSLFAAVTLWWARRIHYSWRQAGSWAVLTLFFNVAGLLLFRLVTDWPRRVPCAACGRPRPIGDARCPHCAAGWPDSPRNGTEIFDQPQSPVWPTTAPLDSGVLP